MTKYYITNAIPYVNAAPHIGHALEFIQSDTISRFHRLLGEKVTYLCGSDENALKNVQAAEKAGETVQVFVDKYASVFEEAVKRLGVEFDIFQKTSDQDKHYKASQKLWKLCEKNGDIYKKSYKGLYCVGCETFYTKEELNKDGECFEHPGKKLEEVEEENYFFRLSTYQKELIELIESDTYQIVPSFRKNEILSFLKSGLEDFSISRSNERAKNWGIPVPGDPTQRIYVWFDALNVYQSGIGFGWDEEQYSSTWPADLHVIGKGIIRFHAVYWPAMLLSAKLSLPKKLFVHEYFTVDGQKMSKTLGNVIDPVEMVEKYGTDALRYYCLAKFSPFSDGDFSEERLRETYNSDLANGLGNLVARVSRLCETLKLENKAQVKSLSELTDTKEYLSFFEEFKFNEVLSCVWRKITEVDQYINQEKPWTLVESDTDKAKEILSRCVEEILDISVLLTPFMPETSGKIQNIFGKEAITAGESLFPRLS